MPLPPPSPADAGLPPTALKEWDAQCQALGTGGLAVILRKGGIMETHEGFEVEHRRFLLYPTFLHQNEAELRPEWRGLLRADPDPGTLHLPAVAEVLAVWKVTELERALELEEVQALTGAAIERRFHYRNRPWLHALLLRVSPLRPPMVLAETPQMLGCVSWVPLGQVGSGVSLGEPVLAEGALEDLRAELTSRLGSGG